MTPTRLLILGGSGFIGSHVVAQLANEGRSIIVPTRHHDRARHLLPLPTVTVKEVEHLDLNTMTALLSECDAAINLIGILHGRPGAIGDPWGPDFQTAHIEVVETLIDACRATGVKRVVHLSALGVTEGSKRALPSRYLRSKSAGEERLRLARDLHWTILRSSVVFGPDDEFLQVFARLQRHAPVVALPGAATRFQPIGVGDVAQAIRHVLDQSRTIQKTYPLVGPEVFTLRELVRLAGTWSGHPRPILGLPERLARLMARLMECLPGKPLLSRDNLDSMRQDSVSPKPLDPDLGIKPVSLRTVGPSLFESKETQRLSLWRARARRAAPSR